MKQVNPNSITERAKPNTHIVVARNDIEIHILRRWWKVKDIIAKRAGGDDHLHLTGKEFHDVICKDPADYNAVAGTVADLRKTV